MDKRLCNICERGCIISEGKTGHCGRYELRDGEITERFPNSYLVTCPISIETMPMLHFHPGGKYLQISTTGCNMDCPGCISTVIVREMSPDSRALKHLSPEQVVTMAVTENCSGIVFLMNDPQASFYTFLKVAKLAKSRGLQVGCSSNNYFTEYALKQLIPYLHFINIGMKGFTDAAYKSCGVSSVHPVLKNIRLLYEAGIHIEVACILRNDNQNDLLELAHFIASISRHIPIQIMRFIPFEEADILDEPSIRDSELFCQELRKIVDFVYLFNTPGTELLNTVCPECGNLIYRRDFYGPMGAKLKITTADLPAENVCPKCGCDLHIKCSPTLATYQEGDFEGGYPFTRALEMVEAMLITMGVNRKSDIVRSWEDILRDGGLKKLHHDIQHPRTYIKTLRYFGELVGVRDSADALTNYLKNRLEQVEKAVATVQNRPRVYYAMASPCFLINGERLENQLVEIAGGISVNKELVSEGRPGRTLDVYQINALNPDVIFISSFISSPVDEFYSECLRLGLNVNAVKKQRIYTHPAPGWDFGSPRWILGLMYIATVLHPNSCDFNVISEAQTFYRQFYNIDFCLSNINRSFSKPAKCWQWGDDDIPT